MIKQDIRWQQRFSNYRKALAKLIQAVDLLSVQIERDESVAELLQEGLIQRFEYTHELAWKVMKDYAEYQGYTDVRGSRDAIRKALEMNLIDDRRWMETIEDRNLTVHNYDNEVAAEIYENIMHVYCPLYVSIGQKMQSLIEPTLFDLLYVWNDRRRTQSFVFSICPSKGNRASYSVWFPCKRNA